MNCNCLQNVISKMKENGFENIEPPVDILSGRIYLSFYGNKKGKKRKREIPVLLSECPFCGEKYEEENKEKEI